MAESSYSVRPEHRENLKKLTLVKFASGTKTEWPKEKAVEHTHVWGRGGKGRVSVEKDRGVLMLKEFQVRVLAMAVCLMLHTHKWLKKTVCVFPCEKPAHKLLGMV